MCCLGLSSEKAMAPHSSTLAWEIPWTEEPGGLQSMGLLRVGHDWATSLSLFTSLLEKKMATHSSVLAWRIRGTGSLVGCHLRGCTELDTTKATQQQQQVCLSFSSKEQASFNFMAAVTIHSDFGAQKIKAVTVSIVSTSVFHEVMGPGAMIFGFWKLSFKPEFSLSTYTFIKRLFNSSLHSATRVMSSASEVIDISPGSLDSSLWFIQPSILHDVLCIEVK